MVAQRPHTPPGKQFLHNIVGARRPIPTPHTLRLVLLRLIVLFVLFFLFFLFIFPSSSSATSSSSLLTAPSSCCTQPAPSHRIPSHPGRRSGPTSPPPPPTHPPTHLCKVTQAADGCGDGALQLVVLQLQSLQVSQLAQALWDGPHQRTVVHRQGL
jgi:hypothetical protein